MKQTFFAIAGLLLLPLTASAQGSIENILINSLAFINNILIPFLFGMAFLVFVFNAIRFFVAQSNNQDGREKARNLITYSLLAFVFLIVFWGIINVLVQSLGLECDRFESKKITSDYEVKYMPPGPTVAICP